jgi:hypothetical protein
MHPLDLRLQEQGMVLYACCSSSHHSGLLSDVHHPRSVAFHSALDCTHASETTGVWANWFCPDEAARVAYGFPVQKRNAMEPWTAQYVDAIRVPYKWAVASRGSLGTGIVHVLHSVNPHSDSEQHYNASCCSRQTLPLSIVRLHTHRSVDGQNSFAARSSRLRASGSTIAAKATAVHSRHLCRPRMYLRHSLSLSMD